MTLHQIRPLTYARKPNPGMWVSFSKFPSKSARISFGADVLAAIGNPDHVDMAFDSDTHCVIIRKGSDWKVSPVNSKIPHGAKFINATALYKHIGYYNPELVRTSNVEVYDNVPEIRIKIPKNAMRHKDLL